MEWELIAGVLGAIVLIGNAGAIIAKWLNPALKVKNDVATLQQEIASIKEHEKNDYEAIKQMQEMNRLQCLAMMQLLNHMIDGNGKDKMKKTRDDIQELLTRVKG